jgi:hypothetical protein
MSLTAAIRPRPTTVHDHRKVTADFVDQNGSHVLLITEGER